MKIYGTWDAFLIEQLAEPEDVSGYLDAVIEEYQIHGNLTTIQLALQYVVKAQGGISELAKKTNIELEVLSEVLSSDEAPRIDTLRTVLSALGCSLSIDSLEAGNTDIEVASEKPTLPQQRTANPNLELEKHPASAE